MRYVCSDMWKPYLKVIAKKAVGAIHVLDRFHIMAHMNKAIDVVRARETKELKAQGIGIEPVLIKSRWVFLKRPDNLTEKQGSKLAEFLKHNLKTLKSYLLKEEFQLFWAYASPYWAERRFSSGVVEGFNNKAKLTTRKAYGLEPIRRLKSLYIMLLATSPYQKLPTDFSEEELNYASYLSNSWFCYLLGSYSG